MGGFALDIHWPVSGITDFAGTYRTVQEAKEAFLQVRDEAQDEWYQYQSELAAERAAERYWEEGTSAQQMYRAAEEQYEMGRLGL